MFAFENSISKLDESGLLFPALESFGNVDLHPASIDKGQVGLGAVRVGSGARERRLFAPRAVIANNARACYRCRKQGSPW